MSRLHRRRFLHAAAAALLTSATNSLSPLAAAPLAPKGLRNPYDRFLFVPNRYSADVAIIDTRHDRLVTRLPVGKEPHQVIISEVSGRLVVTNTVDDTLSIIELATLSPLTILELDETPEHMEIAPDGRLVAVGNIAAGTVSLVSLETLREVRRVHGLYEPHNMTFSPDGRFIYVGNLGADFVSVIDVDAGEVIAEIPVGEKDLLAARRNGGEEYQGIINVTRTSDGLLGFAAHGESGWLAVIDLRTRRMLKRMRLGGLPWRAYSTADGRYMLVPNNADRTVSIISTVPPFPEVARLEGAADMTGINTDGSGKVAFVISRSEGRLVILDLIRLRNVGTIDLGRNSSPETGVTAPDGRRIYVALSGRDEIAVVDSRTRGLMRRIPDVGRGPWGTFVTAALNYCH